MIKKISDKQLEALIEWAEMDLDAEPGPVHHVRLLALKELLEWRRTISPSRPGGPGAAPVR
jgi:hypothetical protein